MFPQVNGWTVRQASVGGPRNNEEKRDVDTLQIVALVLSPIHITRGSMMTHRNGETVPL